MEAFQRPACTAKSGAATLGCAGCIHSRNMRDVLVSLPDFDSARSASALEKAGVPCRAVGAGACYGPPLIEPPGPSLSPSSSIPDIRDATVRFNSGRSLTTVFHTSALSISNYSWVSRFRKPTAGRKSGMAAASFGATC